MGPIFLTSFHGGLNNGVSALELDQDQLTLAENVDLDRSGLGGRRLGNTPVTTSGLVNKVTFLHRHFPNSDPEDTTLWAVSVSGSSSVFAYKDTTWHLTTPTGTQALDTTRGQYAIRGVSRNGKLFLSYPTVSGVDRLHVWDGTSIRVTGLAEPAAPTVGNQGTGSYNTVRYFRVRYTEQVSGVTVRRSEPSESTTFTPNGSSEFARVTKPAAINEGETHWEVEESIDNVNFYRIATVVVATTTYDDDLTPAEVTTTGVLSADIGDYTLQWNPKFVVENDDRIFLGGSWEQAALNSRVGWTPVGTSPGAGNDERLEADTDPYVDLDTTTGGEITGMAPPFQGYIYVFKMGRIYKMIRTGNRSKAYEPILVSDKTGAVPNSVVSGTDEAGRPCLYYLDPTRGAMRIGSQGIQRCGEDVDGTWQTVNLDADLVCHGIFFEEKSQLWYNIATNGATVPNTRIKASTRWFRYDEVTKGLSGGWSIDTGDYMATLCACQFSANINDNTDRNNVLKPFLGTAIANALIIKADTGTQDNGTNYRSRMISRPFVNGLTRKFGALAGVMVAAVSSGESVSVRLIRDFGKENSAYRSIDLTAEGSESLITQIVDSLSLRDCFTMQIEIGDEAADNTDWQIDALALKPSDGEMI